MTAPVGFLDYFVLEASDYIEQLDAQLLGSGPTGPDADALQRLARALRGSATMAKQAALAEMAAGIERVGRLKRERQLTWSPALGGAIVATVDDLKLLLRNVRSWSNADDTRARARIDELARLAPVRMPTPGATPVTTGHDAYMATEAANIGAGLELLATRPGDTDAAVNVLRRVRALRGIASVKDHPSLGDVLEAAEHAAQPLELGEPTLSAERVALLAAAANVLRGVAVAIRGSRAMDQDGPDLSRFAAALDAMQERETGSGHVIPIGDLFFDDGGATIVEASPNPPTSPADRFRLEVVSQGEHLQRLVGDARGMLDSLSRERVRRGLRQALRSLRQTAESYGELEVVEFVSMHSEAVVRLDDNALDSLDDLATVLAQPAPANTTLRTRLSSLEQKRSASDPTPSRTLTPIAAAPGIAPPTSAPQERDRPAAVAMAEVATAVSAPARHVPASATPASTAALGSLLDSSIRNLDALHRTPLSAQRAIEEQPPVPVDMLLYRGRAAIERARMIRDELKVAPGPVDAASLAELFDLLDLALTD